MPWPQRGETGALEQNGSSKPKGLTENTVWAPYPRSLSTVRPAPASVGGEPSLEVLRTAKPQGQTRAVTASLCPQARRCAWTSGTDGRSFSWAASWGRNSKSSASCPEKDQCSGAGRGARGVTSPNSSPAPITGRLLSLCSWALLGPAHLAGLQSVLRWRL